MAEAAIAEFRPTTVRWLFGTFKGLMTLVLIPVGVGLVILAVVAVLNRTTRYSITNERITLQKGIIFRHVDEVELYRVKDIRVRYSLLNAMVNIGEIVVVSTDVSTQDAPWVIRYVKDAKRVREQLRSAVERMRQLRGVRELDRGTISDREAGDLLGTQP